ncbi:UvrD-helicase domain-containing protein [Salinimonas lutimaris]|uniref:UvrD-helicase domain-containing protein n=1 Tax=Salinimonas lutimaris TaxID=914153 RepID=UPI001E49ACE5|nr:UvrD-helicase domain-containing protein [Salinimonas lutimaris]
MNFGPLWCRPTLPGRLLGMRSVELTPDALLIHRGKHVHRIALDSLNAYPHQKENLFSARLVVHDQQQIITLRWLSKPALARLVAKLEQVLTDQAQPETEALVRAMREQAVDNYLKDSVAEELAPRIARAINLYHRTLPEHLSLPVSVTRGLNQLRQIHPLSQHTGRLRRAWENRQLEQRSEFLDNIETNPLTEQQRLAVIRENDRNLVLAAAGTGKTSVMVAKALNLIDTGQARPGQILILAYNSAAAKELKDRLQERAEQTEVSAGEIPSVFTFHALGRRILQQCGISPDISELALDSKKREAWATAWFTDYLQNSDEALKQFIDMQYPAVNPFSFASRAEYEHYIRDIEYRTLKGEVVRGYQELLLANWLFMHGVPYEYEASYITRRRVTAGFDYRPDFWLRGTDIYLDHFGTDRKGHTMVGVDAKQNAHAIHNMRELHRHEGTRLLETYHYQWVEGKLEASLKKQLLDAGVRLKPLAAQDIFAALQDNGGIAAGVTRYLNCLHVIRQEQLDEAGIVKRLNQRQIDNAPAYASLLHRFQQAYTQALAQENAVDFDDMILRAGECVSSQQYTPMFSHILVDEFQDISTARMSLLSALLEYGNSPTLTAVGDDWQSIYRFAGGRLELTTHFDDYVGSHSLTILNKTFRYNSSIAHTAGRFVMENPEQYKKEVDTQLHVQQSQVYLLDNYPDNTVPNTPARVNEILGRIREYQPQASVAIMARYNRPLHEARAAISDHSNLHFWTFHSAKGLEADFCIIIGLTHGNLGFPSLHNGDEIVDALLPDLDDFAHAEERRLFYVALTRARNKCYLIADPYAPSAFLDELLKPEMAVEIISPSFLSKYRQIYKCPNCDTGFFKTTRGRFGNYFACSTGISCDTRPRTCAECGSPSVDGKTESVCNNPDCATHIKLCPQCGRPMKRRQGRRGEFWGCSGYGLKSDPCRYTEDIRQPAR